LIAIIGLVWILLRKRRRLASQHKLAGQLDPPHEMEHSNVNVVHEMLAYPRLKHEMAVPISELPGDTVEEPRNPRRG
jgi:hypothetical protein